VKTQTNADKLVDRYLADLDHAMGRLSPSKRHQIVEEISGHISDGRASLDTDDEVSVRALLDRVGDPEDIAAEAGAASMPSRRGDAWVVWLLLLGGFAAGIGWFVGVALLWSSPTWRTRDKLLGTFVPPGGLLGLFLLGITPGSSKSCSSGEVAAGQQAAATHCVTHGFSLPLPIGLALLVGALVAPILVAVHLEGVRRSS
jgi:hypothetical protein